MGKILSIYLCYHFLPVGCISEIVRADVGVSSVLHSSLLLLLLVLQTLVLLLLLEESTVAPQLLEGDALPGRVQGLVLRVSVRVRTAANSWSVHEVLQPVLHVLRALLSKKTIPGIEMAHQE